MKKQMLFFLILFVFQFPNVFAQSVDNTPQVLEKVKAEIANSLNQVDAQLSKATKDLAATDLKGVDARKILTALCQSNKYAVNCALIDLKGKVVLAEPEEYWKLEGSDISAQEQVIKLSESKKPVFSKLFSTTEGFNVVDFEYPIFLAQGEFAGSLSMLVKPQNLLSDIITPFIQDTQFEVWVMQKDGFIIYDKNAEVIGKNVFTDELYKPFPEFISFCERLAKEEKGNGSYELLIKGVDKSVNKQALWDTISINDLEWRIIVYTISMVQ